ncbi:MAG: DUF6776 family protein [Steroidobacteraceae bacterium]
MAPTPRLVVRAHAPLRRLLLVLATAALACMALFIAFEWGHSNAGFDGRAARLDHSQMREQIGTLEAENRRLRLQFAAQATERIAQIRERTELARTIGELQAQVAQATRDLAFYRSVAGDNTRDAVLKIQQFRVTRGAAPGKYLLRMVLGRPLGREDSINGRIRMTFEGTTAATPVNLDLSSVSAVENGELSFNYRYSQSIEVPLQLPAGFTPARTSVEITPTRKGVNPVRTSFTWTVDN